MILIVTIEARNYADLIVEIQKLKEYTFEYVEFRIDKYNDDLMKALKYLKYNNLRVLATNRYEGSTRAYNKSNYLKTYYDILEYVDLLDFELLKLDDDFRELINKKNTIGSFHNFDNCEVDWEKLYFIKENYNITYLKVAVQVNKKTDLVSLLNRSVDCCIGMGEKGMITRKEYKKYNSEIIYCSLNGNKKIGQLPLSYYQK